VESSLYQINFALAWICILLAFITGGLIGFTFKFFNSDWLGGYTGLRRRMYRLGHVALFALGAVNLMFFFTVQEMSSPGWAMELASMGFMVGAVSMPACCFIMAHFPKAKYLFYIPSTSLICACFITVWKIVGK